MKIAIVKRDVKFKDGKVIRKGRKVFVAQKNLRESLVRLSQGHTIEYPIQNTALKFVDDVKIKLHVKKLPLRSDSMFYYGKHIATLTKGNRTVIVESAGEMEACFKNDGDNFMNEKLAQELKKRKTTDKGLKKIDGMISMNNWFRILCDNDPTRHDEKIAHTYDEAIESAKSLIIDED